MPHVRSLQRNELEDQCEFYCEDSVRLRQVAHEQPPADALGGWQRCRQSKMAQLETLNAELERMISDLEEERRRKHASQMLCARYHGKYDPVDCNLRRTLSACMPLQSTCIASLHKAHVERIAVIFRPEMASCTPVVLCTAHTIMQACTGRRAGA